MIFSALISFGAYVVYTILDTLPSSTGLPANVGTAVTFIGGYLGILDPIIPITTLTTVLSLVIAFELAVFAFKGFKWMISHIPLVGGRG